MFFRRLTSKERRGLIKKAKMLNRYENKLLGGLFKSIPIKSHGEIIETLANEQKE